MGKTSNIIEINGQRYDARNGALLTVGADQPQSHHTIDGIVKTASVPHPSTLVPSNPVIKPTHQIAKPSMQDVVRSPGQYSQSRTLQPSSTLMRHVVKKPGTGPKHKPTVKAHSSTDGLLPQPKHALRPKQSIGQLDPRRAQHATQVTKSGAVSRFSDVKPVGNALPPIATRQAPAHTNQTLQTRQTPPKAKTTADLLEQALNQASSHEQQSVSTSRFKFTRRTIAISTTLVVFLALGSFMISSNLTSLKLQFASAKAGFTAGLPSYRPAGFSSGELSYTSGVVAMNFKSNSDDRAYTLTEKISSWNSQTLRDNFVTKTANSYQTVSEAGRTIYLYGNNQASWVSNGIWYQLQSNGSLSNHQLIQIADSL